MIPSGPTLRLLIFCGVILIGPILLGPGLFKKSKFDYALKEEIKAENPEYVFIGDSMLLSRLDPERLSKMMGGPRITILAEYGLSSAAWFVMFKNFVIDNDIKPKVVTIFFRDFALSWPRYRTTGLYRERLEPYMLTDEPEMERVWSGATKTFKDRVGENLENIYSLQQRAPEAGDVLQGMALSMAPDLWSPERLFEEVNDVFELRNLRGSVPTELADSDSPDLEKFDPSRDETFVPYMLAAAKAKGIRLCFYRVKRRPPANSDYRIDSPELAEYLRTLEEYTHSQGMLFYDANKDLRENISMFADGDHIDEKFKGKWTEIFYDQLGGVLK